MISISVLIRTLGSEEKLKDALASLRLQTFKHFEVVIVEDGPESLRPFLNSYSDLKICYEALGRPHGRGVAGNRAFSLSQGRHCIFLDDDDLFYPEHLENLWSLVGRSAVVYSGSEQRGVDRNERGAIVFRSRYRRWRRDSFCANRLRWENYIPINALLFDRRLFEKVGGFENNFPLLEDWSLWLKFLQIEEHWAASAEVSAIYHVPANRITAFRRRREIQRWVSRVRGSAIPDNPRRADRVTARVKATIAFLKSLYPIGRTVDNVRPANENDRPPTRSESAVIPPSKAR